jgi:hypothetical protein
MAWELWYQGQLAAQIPLGLVEQRWIVCFATSQGFLLILHLFAIFYDQLVRVGRGFGL